MAEKKLNIADIVGKKYCVELNTPQEARNLLDKLGWFNYSNPHNFYPVKFRLDQGDKNLFIDKRLKAYDFIYEQTEKMTCIKYSDIL